MRGEKCLDNNFRELNAINLGILVWKIIETYGNNLSFIKAVDFVDDELEIIHRVINNIPINHKQPACYRS